jgi:hypothetical protein
MFKSMKVLATALMLLTAGLGGCAVDAAGDLDSAVVEDEETGEAAQRIATATDIAHACEHARNPDGGVYINISPTAAASGSSPVCMEHEAYDMTLPGGTTKSGFVKFSPDETAEHGIYTDPSTTVCVKTANAAGTGTTGNCLTQVFTTTISATTCPASTIASLPTFGTTAALSRVRTYNLTLGVNYFVQFTKTGSASMLGMLENLDEIP